MGRWWSDTVLSCNHIVSSSSWVNVILTYSSNTVSLYLNGVSECTGSSSATIAFGPHVSK
jgi:hypothetical protein